MAVSMTCGFGLYAFASVAVAAWVVYYAATTRVQFYPVMLYLSTSKPSLVVLANMAFVMLFSFGRFVKWLFLGSLRLPEIERVNDHFKYMLLETLVALTVFREELSMRIAALFACMLFAKFFHVVSECRVELVEVDRSMPRRKHIGLISLMVVMLASDLVALSVFAHVVREHGASVLILFGFEAAVMAFSVLMMAFRYTVYMIDRRIEGHWVNKNMYIMFAELFIELCKLFLCMVYLVLIFTYYGFPLLMLRDLWQSFSRVNLQLQNLVKSRRITRQMHDNFLDATPQQLEEGDSTCIICMDEMVAPGPKRLPCGHMLHLSCLRSWMERQQTCPICRYAIDLDNPRVQAANARRDLGVVQAADENENNGNVNDANANANANGNGNGNGNVNPGANGAPNEDGDARSSNAAAEPFTDDDSSSSDESDEEGADSKASAAAGMAANSGVPAPISKPGPSSLLEAMTSEGLHSPAAHGPSGIPATAHPAMAGYPYGNPPHLGMGPMGWSPAMGYPYGYPPYAHTPAGPAGPAGHAGIAPASSAVPSTASTPSAASPPGSASALGTTQPSSQQMATPPAYHPSAPYLPHGYYHPHVHPHATSQAHMYPPTMYPVPSFPAAFPGQTVGSPDGQVPPAPPAPAAGTPDVQALAAQIAALQAQLAVLSTPTASAAPPANVSQVRSPIDSAASATPPALPPSPLSPPLTGAPGAAAAGPLPPAPLSLDGTPVSATQIGASSTATTFASAGGVSAVTHPASSPPSTSTGVAAPVPGSAASSPPEEHTISDEGSTASNRSALELRRRRVAFFEQRGAASPNSAPDTQ